jgi:deoxyribodipyrimidine photo-lyase
MKLPEFPTSYTAIMERVVAIDPIDYANTRNYVDGSVTYLSPYLSRGVISTRDVVDQLIHRNFRFDQVEKLVQELAWRDYYQRNWESKGEEINEDMKQPQHPVLHYQMPINIVNATTNIWAIDKGISDLYETGYMHNHVRMYTAFLSTNLAQAHWRQPARWMYYHLLDGDWASNALSWQWVAGSFSSKKYMANQENINTYTRTHQSGTYIDLPYEQLLRPTVPDPLIEVMQPSLTTNLPQRVEITFDNNLPTYIYNYYNLDPNWDSAVKANRIVLLEPDHFKRYPVGDKALNFALQLAKEIVGAQILAMDYHDFISTYQPQVVHFKTHPLFNHYQGIEHTRSWINYEISGYYPSFFAYWKKIRPTLILEFGG